MNPSNTLTQGPKKETQFLAGRTPKFLQTTLLSALFFMLLGVGESWGQCTGSSNGQFPSNTFTPTTTWSNISTICYSNEYSVIAVTCGSVYSFRSYLTATNTTARYTTVTNADASVVLVHGSTSNTVSITWTSTYTGTVRMYTHKDALCAGTGTNSQTRQAIVVNGSVPAQPSAISGNSSFCSSTNQTYSVTNVSGVTYTWSYSGTGTITGSGNSVSLNASTGGTLTVTPSNCVGNGTSRTLTLTANTVPSAVTVSGGAICSGGTITASGGTGGTIYWQGTTSGGTSTTSSGTTSPAITAAGTYYARAQSSAGCWGTEGSASVTLQSVSTAPAITGTICSSSTTVSGTGINGSSINVLRSGSSIGTATVSGGVWTATVSSLAANDVLTATQTESGKCVSAASASATVIACSPPIVSSFSPSSGCANGQIVISGTNLSTVTAVTVNGNAVSSFTINSGTQITATLGAGTTSGTVSVTNPYGTATSSSTYTVYTIGWANTQYPATGTICPSGSFDVYGQIYAANLTPPTGAGSGIVAQLGYSTSNTNPNTWTNWVSTTFNTESGNNDEYKGTLSGLAAGTYYYAFRYTLGTGCSYTYGGTAGVWNNDNGTLTVNANHAIALSSAAGTTSQTVCVNNALTAITYTLSGGATGASVSGLPSGVSASVSGTTLTISGTPSIAGSYSYTVSTTGNSCTTASASGTITVGGTINWANTQYPASGTICTSGTYTIYGQVYQPGVTNAAGQGAGITVQYGYSTTSSDPTSGSGWTWANATYNTTSSGNNDEYMGTLSGLSAGTYYYAFRYKITASTACGYQYGGYNGGFWNGTSNISGVLTVNGNPTISSQPSSGSQSVCVSGSPTALSVTASTTVGSLSYQWYSNTTASTSGASAISGATSASYTPSAAAAGTLYYYCAVTNSCGTTNSGFSGAIIVNAAPIGITTTAAASNASVCAGGTSSLSLSLTKSGNVSSGVSNTTLGIASNAQALSPFTQYYEGQHTQYLYLASDLIAAGLSAGNITSLSFNISTKNSTMPYTNYTIKLAPTSLTSLTSGNNSATFTTVYASSTTIGQGVSTTVGTNTFAFGTGSGTSSSFNWDGSSSILVDICFSNDPSSSGTYYSNTDIVSAVTKSYTSTYGYYGDNSALCGATNANTSSSTSLPVITFTGNTAPTPSSYSWSNGSSTIGSTNPYVATVNSTTTFTGTATFSTGCSVSSSTTVNALSAPEIGTQPTALTKCVGQAASFSVVASGTGLTYQWKKDGLAISGATAASYSIAAVSVADAGSYSVDVTGCSTTVASSAVALSVNANPTAVATSNGPLCANANLTLTGTSDIGTTFAWTGPNSFTSTAQSPTISSVTTAASGTYTFSATSNGCSTSGTVTVTVNPVPTSVTSSSNSASVCDGTSVNLTSGSTSNSSALTLASENFDSGLPSGWTVIQNGTGNLWAQTTSTTYGTPYAGSGMLQYVYNSTNAANTYAITSGYSLIAGVTYTINFYELTSNLDEKLKLTVGTAQTAAAQSTVIIDYGLHQLASWTLRTNTFTPTTSGVYYFGLYAYSAKNKWYIDIDNFSITYSPPSTYSWTSSPAGYTSSTQNPTGVAPTQTTTYTVTATNSYNCSATASTTVTVNSLPTATISAGSATTFCSGGSVELTASAGSSFVWKKDGVTISGATAQTYTATAAGSYTVTVTNANGCSATSAATTVTVNTLPNMPTASNVTLCGTGSVTLTADNPGIGLSVNWYNAAQTTQLAAASLTYTTPSLSTTTSYYAETVNTSTGCVSTNRVEVQAIVNVTNTFTDGSGDHSWFTAGNWSCGSVPNATTNVIIPTAKTVSVFYNVNGAPAYAYTVVLEGTASVTVTTDHSINVTNKVTVASGATFTVQNNASLVQTDNVTNEGNITVQKSTPSNRLLKRFDAVLWSSPVVQNLRAISTGTPDAYFMQHNPQTNSWSAVSSPATADFTKGKGFLVRTPSTFPTTATQQWNVTFTGVPNNGNVTISAGNTGNTEKYLLVGNPYPSAISIAAFRAANPNITGVFYFFRKPNGVTGISSYGTLSADGSFAINDNAVGAVSPGSVIPSGQGFFVAMKSDNNNGEVYFTNAMRVANNHGTFNRMNTNLDTYRLLVQTPVGGNSQFITNYDAETTSGYDVGYDAIAFTDGTTDLSMIMNAKNYRIQSRGQYNAADLIPVQFKTATAGEHRIKLQDAQGVFAADQMVIIKDNLTGVQHNLTANGDYVFTATAGTFTNRFEVVYQQAYYTALQANSCGATIANMNSLVYADIVNGATGYRFKVVNNTTAAVQTIDRPQHWFAFNMLSSYDYNTPYTISVQVQKDGVWTGYYGATCTVNSPNIAATGVMQINPSQCGATLATLGTVIATTPVAGATGYKFRITNTTAGATGSNMVQEITRSNHWFTLAMLSRYNYGSSYTVEVAVKTTGAFTPYGNACTVYSPSAPTLASCGQTVATATTLVRTTAMTLATQYRFQVTRMSTQETITFDTANFWFSFRVNVPGYAAGEQYGVRVAVMTAGAWSPFGDACDITAPIASARSNEEASPSEANLFKPVAYPNPFKSAFSIALATPFQDDVTLVVYDLQGRLIEKQTVPVSLIDTIHIGANYQMGDYMLVVSQGSAIESMLLHKE